jgi:hypothetical protein
VALPPDDGEPVARRRRAGEKQPPAVIPTLSNVSVDLAAQIKPFGGDMRDAFIIIDQLVASLQSNSKFSHVTVMEYPLDANPRSSVSGEVVRGGIDRDAHFRLRLRMAAVSAEGDDETG